MSQREVANASGVSQSTISRIEDGRRPAKVPELVAIARATGTPLPRLLATSPVADRVESAARATGAGTDAMRHRLLHFLELDAYLETQGIPESA